MKWIKQGAERVYNEDIEEEVVGVMNSVENIAEDLEDIDLDRISPE